MTVGLLSLAPETHDDIATYLDLGDAFSLAVTHSALLNPAQRSIFRHVAFSGKSDDGKRYLQFLLALGARPDLGAYVRSLSIRHNFHDLRHPKHLANTLGLLDELWTCMPLLKHLHLTLPSLPALTFEGCTNTLLSLSLPYCNDSTHEFLLRSNALLRLSLGGPVNQSLPYSYPVDALQRLRCISAHTLSILTIVPASSVTHLKLLTEIGIGSSFEFAAALSTMAAPLHKLYLPVLITSFEECALLPGLPFLLPMEKRHFASLTSLTLIFSMQPPLLDSPHNICEGLPTALKSLRTLRLWCSFVRLYSRSLWVEELDAEAEAVRVAHKRCPALQHVSLFSRIDWYSLGEARWVPSPRGSQKAAARAWLRAHPDMEAPHKQGLDTAETDSLLDEEEMDDDVQQGTSDDDVEQETSDDEEYEGVLYSEEFLQHLEEELDDHYAFEQQSDPYTGSGLSQDIPNDTAHLNLWGDGADGPLTSLAVDELLDDISAAHRAGLA